MSPEAERLYRAVMMLVRAELDAVFDFCVGLRAPVERDVDELRAELVTLARRLPAQSVHALVEAARALTALVREGA